MFELTEQDMVSVVKGRAYMRRVKGWAVGMTLLCVMLVPLLACAGTGGYVVSVLILAFSCVVGIGLIKRQNRQDKEQAAALYQQYQGTWIRATDVAQALGEPNAD